MAFIPTRTMAEWVSFRDLPPAGVAIAGCAPVCNPATLDPEPGKMVSYAGYPFYWNGSQWDIDCQKVYCFHSFFGMYYAYNGSESAGNVFWSYPYSYHVNWNTYQWEYGPNISCQ